MDRREKELREKIEKAAGENALIIEQLIDEVFFLEGKLKELRTLPFIKVDPNNPQRQKATPAEKQYKELLQQYNNSLKILLGVAKEDEKDGTSPLREWAEIAREVFGGTK